MFECVVAVAVEIHKNNGRNHNDAMSFTRCTTFGIEIFVMLILDGEELILWPIHPE